MTLAVTSGAVETVALIVVLVLVAGGLLLQFTGSRSGGRFLSNLGDQWRLIRESFRGRR